MSLSHYDNMGNILYFTFLPSSPVRDMPPQYDILSSEAEQDSYVQVILCSWHMKIHLAT